MFSYFYQVCTVIFLLQGLSIPLLLVLFGVLWRNQARQLEFLNAELEQSRQKIRERGKAFELILSRLPKLQPLNCRNCGAGVALRELETFCPHCHTRGELPEDYVAAVSLKSKARALLKSATRHWRVANLLTSPVVGAVFFALIFIEPLVLFPTVLIGSSEFRNTWIDKVLESLGPTASFLLMLVAFLAFIVWMILFIFLAGLSKSLRANLPVVPVFDREEPGAEAASCQACGGGIEYDVNDFVSLCTYCNVENFRVRFARRERARTQSEEMDAGSALFEAMVILEEFVGTFFCVSFILVVACILLTTFLRD